MVDLTVRLAAAMWVTFVIRVYHLFIPTMLYPDHLCLLFVFQSGVLHFVAASKYELKKKDNFLFNNNLRIIS